MTTDPYTLLPDDLLRQMIDRAYWSAVGSWQEARAFRATPDPLTTTYRDVADILTNAAESADDYYHRLTDEQNRRDAERIAE
jgi:hypothetical protein